MNKPTLPDDWMHKALDAGASALRAVNDGRALPVDDLLAGAMAIEMLAALKPSPAEKPGKGSKASPTKD